MQQKLISRIAIAFLALMFIASTALAGEPIPGIDVKLGKNGRTVATETTGQNGMVKYTGLTPNEEYTVSVDLDALTKLMKAKEKGNRTKCSNNLRLVGGKHKWSTDPYVEDTQRLKADDQGEITLQLTGECTKP